MIDIKKGENSEKMILFQNQILTAINSIFEITFLAENDKLIAKACLNIAEGLTNSKFGFIGFLNETGRFDTLAISDPGFAACQMKGSKAVRLIENMEVRGIWGRVILEGQSLLTNNPSAHPDSVGTPEGHPKLTSFLGVPFKEEGKTLEEIQTEG